MKIYKPVSISKNAFVFCRLSMAIIIWLAFILKLKYLIVFAFFIFLFSAILKVKKAPMILLYEYTIGKLIKSKTEVLNEKAMYFAHSMGTIFSLICLVSLYFISEPVGWGIVFVFAILKSISAFGFCPASKLYECATNDSCCAFIKKHD